MKQRHHCAVPGSRGPRGSKARIVKTGLLQCLGDWSSCSQGYLSREDGQTPSPFQLSDSEQIAFLPGSHRVHAKLRVGDPEVLTC